MGSGTKVEIEGAMDLNQAISYLEDVLNSMKEGIIRVETGEEMVMLRPSQAVDFEMSASQKKDKEKFALKLSWKKTKGDIKEKDLKIGS
jgi:amphi-Trp domain-containing protein